MKWRTGCANTAWSEPRWVYQRVALKVHHGSTFCISTASSRFLSPQTRGPICAERICAQEGPRQTRVFDIGGDDPNRVQAISDTGSDQIEAQ